MLILINDETINNIGNETHYSSNNCKKKKQY